MSEWRLDQVGRDLDGGAPPAAPPPTGEASGAVPGGRPRPPRDGPKGGSLGWLWLLLAAVLFGAAGGFGLWYVFLAPPPIRAVEPVMINADRSPVRVQPEDPGGLAVPHRDRLVLQDRADAGPPAEAAVRPDPEQPMPMARAELARPSDDAVSPEAPGAEDAPSADPIADLLARTEEAARRSAEAAPADTAPPAAEAARTARAEGADGASPPSPADSADRTVAALDPPAADAESEETAIAAPESPEADAPPVEVLMPRLPEAGEAPGTAADDPPAADGDAEAVAAASGTAGAETASTRTAANAAAGPLTASTLGRDPASLGRGGDDPFVDLLTALSWPADRSYPQGRADGRAPLVGTLTGSPSEGIEVAGLGSDALPAPEAGPPQAQAPAAPPAEQPFSRDAIGQRFLPQPDGDFRVQIVAVQAEPDASSEWRRYAATYPDLLGGFEPYVQRIDLGERGVWYRVQAGPLDRADADALCGALKERGADCIVRQR